MTLKTIFCYWERCEQSWFPICCRRHTLKELQPLSEPCHRMGLRPTPFNIKAVRRNFIDSFLSLGPGYIEGISLYSAHSSCLTCKCVLQTLCHHSFNDKPSIGNRWNTNLYFSIYSWMHSDVRKVIQQNTYTANKNALHFTHKSQKLGQNLSCFQSFN